MTDPSSAKAANESSAKASGPASYFPSIEKTYGQPIEHWKALLRGSGVTVRKDLVALLKDDHGMGHGHANAIVAHLLAEGSERPSTDAAVDVLFPAKKAHWRPVYDKLAAHATKLDGVQVLPKKTLVGFGTNRQFLMVQPSTPERFDVGLNLPGVAPTARLEEAGAWNTLMTHRVQITDPKQVDKQLLTWITQAHAASR